MAKSKTPTVKFVSPAPVPESPVALAELPVPQAPATAAPVPATVADIEALIRQAQEDHRQALLAAEERFRQTLAELARQRAEAERRDAACAEVARKARLVAAAEAVRAEQDAVEADPGTMTEADPALLAFDQRVKPYVEGARELKAELDQFEEEYGEVIETLAAVPRPARLQGLPNATALLAQGSLNAVVAMERNLELLQGSLQDARTNSRRLLDELKALRRRMHVSRRQEFERDLNQCLHELELTNGAMGAIRGYLRSVEAAATHIRFLKDRARHDGTAQAWEFDNGRQFVAQVQAVRESGVAGERPDSAESHWSR